MPTPPDKPIFSDEEEFGESYPVAMYEGKIRATLELPVGKPTTIELQIVNSTGLPVIEYSVNNPALQVSHELGKNRTVILTLRLTEAVEADLFVLVNDGSVPPDEILKEGERLILTVKPL